MFVPDEMKLNKFKLCSIPSNKDYFTRYGFNVTPSNQYSGDEVAPMPMTKLQNIEDYERYARMKEVELESNYNKNEK